MTIEDGSFSIHGTDCDPHAEADEEALLCLALGREAGVTLSMAVLALDPRRKCPGSIGGRTVVEGREMGIRIEESRKKGRRRTKSFLS